jgi:hypothetical protein
MTAPATAPTAAPIAPRTRSASGTTAPPWKPRSSTRRPSPTAPCRRAPRARRLSLRQAGRRADGRIHGHRHPLPRPERRAGVQAQRGVLVPGATDDQAETDRLWNAIVGNGGQESACGWCKDKWGLSWQITPRVLTDAITDPDPAAAKRAFDAMMRCARSTSPSRSRRPGARPQARPAAAQAAAAPASPTEAFHRHRQAQGRRARVLGMLVIEVDGDHGISLRRAPDLRAACARPGDRPTASPASWRCVNARAGGRA